MDGKTIRKYRNKATIEEHRGMRPLPEKVVVFNWNGEPDIQFRAWYGTLVFESGETGFDVDWFRGRIFSLRPYRGNIKLKLAGRPSKDLKSLYQEAGISGDERKFLPIICWEGEIIYAAKIGQASQYQGRSGKCIQLKWVEQL